MLGETVSGRLEMGARGDDEGDGSGHGGSDGGGVISGDEGGELDSALRDALSITAFNVLAPPVTRWRASASLPRSFATQPPAGAELLHGVSGGLGHGMEIRTFSNGTG